MITLVIFSKDRAMQLDSLFRSVEDHCTGIDRTVVVAKTSSELHRSTYLAMANDFDSVDCIFEGPRGLGQALQSALGLRGVKPHGEEEPRAETTFEHPKWIGLAVDDMLFYRPSDFRMAAAELEGEAFAWSWRLGAPPGWPPPFGDANSGERWRASPFTDNQDYGYMFHTDGAIYCTADYVKMLDAYLPDWKTGAYTPNDLEAGVASKASSWKPRVGPHLGPIKPTCITWQLNRVQTAYGSPAAEIPATNVDALAKAYLEGKRVDNEKLYAALRENPFQWNPPGARPTHVWACEEASKFWASAVR